MEKPKPVNFSTMSHSDLKNLGNKYFATGDIQRAINCYSHAIEKNSSISTYYSNRALCFLNIHNLEKALSDCRKALEVDRNNLKAFFFIGECYLALTDYDKAITNFTQAQNLALEHHRNFSDDIASKIRLAKRKRLEIEDEQRRKQEIELQNYLHKLILEDAERSKTKFETSSAWQTDNTSSEVDNNVADQSENGSCKSLLEGDNLNTNVVINSVETENTTGISKIDAEASRRLKELDEMFNQLDDRRKKREVPDYLCGQISFQIMKDAMITPSGITYDHKSILAHLQKVGHFDPVTRQPLIAEQLIPNLSMREVISKFLEDNPWAEHY